MRYLLAFYFLIFGFNARGQSDSVKVDQDRNDGIYLTYSDFRKNIYIGKEQVVSETNKELLDFLARVLYAERFSYNTGGGLVTEESKNVWGFYQNKTLYVNYRGEFFRVPVFGAIGYLVATVTVVNSGFYDPMFGYGVNSSRTKEIREFIVNFYDGIVSDFTMEKAEELLSRDQTLFSEFSKLGRRSRKEQLNRYIRRYNEAHPVYFLK